jgi:phosphoribosylformylglycinamidine (FGAM) synthase PurS component
MPQSADIAGYSSLGDDVNKLKRDTTPENKPGVVSEKLPELVLEMSDEEIVRLTNAWETAWKDSPAKQEWEKQIDENEKYWLGNHHDLPKLDDSRPSVDNLIFESLETYLPQMTRRNPEPITALDAIEDTTPAFEKYVAKVKARLADLSDKNKIRLKLKKAGRHWAIFQLAVAKFGWDLDKDIPIVKIVRPKKIILDPEATVDEDGYTGERIGEYRKMAAGKLLKLIGENEKAQAARKAITDKVSDNLGTDIQFVEWWTKEYMCWKLGSTILLKRKNPHWNYDGTEVVESVDDYGNATQTPQTTQGINHFPSPEMPYKFLSVFNLGDQPMDKTSLIGQNLSNQDRINKRNSQIDRNADDMNGGIVVSMARSGLTKPQAEGVTKALRKGGTVVIPDGSPREAVDRYPAPGLPPDVYNNLLDMRSRLRDIFGVKGSSQAGLEGEKLATGKLISRTLDTDRIGGGVSEYLEQFADDIYNWFVQLLYVYDLGFQFLGGARPPKITVSVKEGSLLPKDSITIANQALELAGLNRISTLDLFKRLEYPNPDELAANVWLEANAPHLLYQGNPLVQQAVAAQQAAAAVQERSKQEEGERSHEMDMENEAMKATVRGK